MAKILYVMCGVAFSGKTTLARELASRRSFYYICLDRINLERGLVPGGEGLPAEEWARTMEIAKERIAGLMATNTPIVVDDTGCFRFIRDGYRVLAAAHGYCARIIHLATPIQEVQRRVLENKATGARAGLKKEVLREHLSVFEPPGVDEDVLVYVGGDMNEWIEREIP